MNLLTRKTLRDLRRSRAQTIALVSVVALGVTTFVAAIGAYLDLDASETRTFDRLRFADAWYELEPVDAATVAPIADRPGVAAAATRLVLDTGLPIGGGDRVRARLVGVPAGAPEVNAVHVIDGQARDGPGQVLIERHFAEARGIEPGDTVTPTVNGRPLPLRVAGTVASPEYLQVTPDRFELLPAPSSFAVLFVDLAELQAATARPRLVNDLAIRLEPGAGAATATRIEEALRGRGVLRQMTRRADQATYAALEQDLAAFRSVAIAMPTLILLAGIVSVAALLGRLVRAQRPTIGIIKAVGYSDGTVLRHYLTYAVVLGMAGSLLGLAAGTALGGVITRGYANELGIPFTATRFHPVVATIALAATLAAATVAAIRPAWRSARIPPASAVRVDMTAAVTAKRSRFEGRLRLPVGLRLPLRALRRSRSRTAGTVVGITTAFVLVLMVLGLRDGIGLFLRRTFDDLERWDISATFDVPQPAGIADQVRRMNGVEQASPFLQLPAMLTARDRREDVLLTALDTDQQLRALRLGDASPSEAFSGDAIVLTDSLADGLGVGTGDRITVATPAGARDLTVGGTSDEPIPARAYLSLRTAARLAGTDTPPINGLYLAADARRAAEIRNQLFALPGIESVKLRQEQRDDIESLLAVFTAIMAIMLVFAFAMAFALVFNTTTINVLEREREYATMRALGAQPAAIAGQLAAEATVLWALAVGPGLLAGTWVAQQLGQAVAAGLFDLPIELSASSYAATAAGILAISYAALALPLRRVARLDLAAATKTLG